MKTRLTAIKGQVQTFYQHITLDTKVNILFGNDINAGTVKEKRTKSGWDVGLG